MQRWPQAGGVFEDFIRQAEFISASNMPGNYKQARSPKKNRGWL